MGVSRNQRFTRTRPCPICGGYEGAPRGREVRCFGFLSDDGEYAHCTREEHAGTLQQHLENQAYAHRLAGDCRCGTQHGLPEPGSDPESQITATYDYTDETRALLFQVVRFLPKGFRQRRPDRVGGWIWNLINNVRRVLYALPQVLRKRQQITLPL